MHAKAGASLLINARFGVCDLVQARDFEPIGVPPLAFVHVVAKG